MLVVCECGSRSERVCRGEECGWEEDTCVSVELRFPFPPWLDVTETSFELRVYSFFLLLLVSYMYQQMLLLSLLLHRNRLVLCLLWRS